MCIYRKTLPSRRPITIIITIPESICETYLFFISTFFFFFTRIFGAALPDIYRFCIYTARLNRKCKPIGVHACFHRNTFRNRDGVFFFFLFSQIFHFLLSPGRRRRRGFFVTNTYHFQSRENHYPYPPRAARLYLRNYYNIPHVRSFGNDHDDGVLYVRSPTTHILLPFLWIIHFWTFLPSTRYILCVYNMYIYIFIVLIRSWKHYKRFCFYFIFFFISVVYLDAHFVASPFPFFTRYIILPFYTIIYYILPIRNIYSSYFLSVNLWVFREKMYFSYMYRYILFSAACLLT